MTAFWIAILGFARFARCTLGFMRSCAPRSLDLIPALKGQQHTGESMSDMLQLVV